MDQGWVFRNSLGRSWDAGQSLLPTGTAVRSWAPGPNQAAQACPPASPSGSWGSLAAEPEEPFLAWSPAFGYPHWGSPYLESAGRTHSRAVTTLLRPVSCLRDTCESRCPPVHAHWPLAEECSFFFFLMANQQKIPPSRCQLCCQRRPRASN